MVIHANPDAKTDESWRHLLQREAEGDVPLPLIDTLIIDRDRAPSIRIIVPEATVAEEPTGAYVSVEDMNEPDHLGLQVILKALEDESIGRLAAVFHAGGLDYEFHYSGGAGYTLKSRPVEEQSILWALLHTLAQLCMKYIDMSTIDPVQA